MTNPNHNPNQQSESGSSISSSRNLSRRQLVGAAAGVGALSLTAGAQTPVGIWKRHPAEVVIFRFRRAFTTALTRQRKAGKIDKKTYVKLKRAAWSGMPYALNHGFQKPDSVGTFIYHLRAEIKGKNTATGPFTDLIENLDIFELFERLVNWLVENWEVVLRVALSLLMFLENAEAE